MKHNNRSIIMGYNQLAGSVVYTCSRKVPEAIEKLPEAMHIS